MGIANKSDVRNGSDPYGSGSLAARCYWGDAMKWREMQVGDVHYLCNSGSGDAIDLPPVPHEHERAVAEWLWEHSVKEFEDPKTWALGMNTCTECDTPVGLMGDPKGEHDICGQDHFVAIACEGYHTPLFRAVYQAMLKANFI